MASETKTYPSPLAKSGSLDKTFAFEETTPVIGREYSSVNIVDDILSASNADDLIRDLAITISERGVVFFRAQNNLTDALQKQLVHRLGQLTNKPSDSTLHIHPILNNTSEFGVNDAEISTISSLQRKKTFGHEKSQRPTGSRHYDAAQWHSDIQFEPVPADYTSLRLTQLPETGLPIFFETLTATFIGEGFIKAAAANPEKIKIYEQQRGSAKNVGKELTAVHPVVRTNPVTGWKSIFALGPFPRYINELNDKESSELLAKFLNVIYENHDLQVRFKWKSENDLGLGERFGNRAVGIGEVPFLDPNSRSRTEVLEEKKQSVKGETGLGLDKSNTVSA
ncbi:hypothetical protein N0V94_002443 [Neodidymelliopsis sp. IMI 364377]|nr:hypothetical protein N0V94_002443 [Neodidymelliopsis sp. IMI 364377]